MNITKLNICNLRNIRRIELEPSTKINLIYGLNGAGKTTILEAIYLLARNRSFRTNTINSLITHKQNQLSLKARLSYSDQSTLNVGLIKSINQTISTINDQKIYRASSLAKNLPVGIITPNIYRLLEDGPSVRRRFLDWGLFHVEHDHSDLILKYKSALKQRNYVLQNKPAEIRIWDDQLVHYGEILDKKRFSYVEKLKDGIFSLLKDFGIQKVSIDYYRGWKKDESFANELKRLASTDEIRGYTSVGPHRADLAFKYRNQRMIHQLSRGQLKIISICLVFSQLNYFDERSSDSPVLLLDDIFYELDKNYETKLLDIVVNSPSQIFLTAIEKSRYEELTNKNVFHVEHGRIV